MASTFHVNIQRISDHNGVDVNQFVNTVITGVKNQIWKKTLAEVHGSGIRFYSGVHQTNYAS